MDKREICSIVRPRRIGKRNEKYEKNYNDPKSKIPGTLQER